MPVLEPADRRSHRDGRAPAVPAACRRSCSCRSSRIWGLATDIRAVSVRASARSTSGSPGGCSAGCRSRAGSGSPRRSSSPSAPCSGTRPSSARPGSSPTSSRSPDSVLARRAGRWRPRRRSRSPTSEVGRRRPAVDARIGIRAGRSGPASGAPWRLLDRPPVPRRAAVRARLHRAAHRSSSGRPFFMLVGGGGSLVQRDRSRPASGAAHPGRACCSCTTSRPPAISSIPATTTCTSSRPTAIPTLNYHANWGIEDLRYLPQNLGIMFLSAPAICPGQRERVLTSARRSAPAPCAARPVRRACPIVVPQQRRDEPPPDEPGAPARDPGRCSSRRSTGSCRARTSRAPDRVRQPDALQPGLGPVRLPVQQRLRAVRAAPGRRSGWRAAVGSAGSAWVLIAASVVDQPVGRDLGNHAGVVSPARYNQSAHRRRPSLAVGRARRRLDRAGPRWSPAAGRRVLGHGRVPDRPAAPRHRPPDRLPDVRDPRLRRATSCSRRSATRRSG